MQHSMHEAICNYKTAGAHYCTYLHLVWNVVVMLKLFTHSNRYREESKERKYKEITMAQWITRLRNNSFVKGKG